MLLIFLAAGWAVGIALAAALALPTPVWLLLLFIPFGYLLIWWRDPKLRQWHWVLIALVLGALRYEFALPSPADQSLAQFNDSGRASLVGIVVSDPEVRDTYTLLRVDVNRILFQGEWQMTSGLALVRAPRDAVVRYGDEIQADGFPETPQDGADFSYRDFLARQAIFTLMGRADVYALSHDHGEAYWSAIYDLRAKALTAVDQLLPDPSASLLAGILLGIEHGIPHSLQDAFAATNTAHVIAISGFNIAILAGFLGFLFNRYTPRFGFLFIITALVLYTLFVGASASVVRAAIMGALAVLAQKVGRQTWALNSLAFAAFVMSLLNPYVLWDVGFQLSFLATLGLVIYVPRFKPRVEEWLKERFDATRRRLLLRLIEDSVIVTVAAWIGTTPLIVAIFHRVSIIGFLTNLLILPVQPPIMILGGVATALQVLANAAASVPLIGIILAGLAQVIAWGAFVFLQYTILVVQATAAVPFGSFEVPRVDWGFIVIAYLIILLVSHFSLAQIIQMLVSRAATVVSLIAFLGIFVWATAYASSDGRTHIDFIATAGGDATFIRTADDERILINGSAEPSALLSFIGGQLPPWDRRLDIVIATHLDENNLASLNAVLERFAVGQVIEPPPPERANTSYLKWRELIQKNLYMTVPAEEGVEVRGGEVRVAVVYPRNDPSFLRAGAGRTTNAVLRLEVNGQSFLYAPVLNASDRAALLQNGMRLDADVAVLPTQFEKELLERISPTTVILFVGKSAREQPPLETLYLLQGHSVLRTDERGMIMFVLENGRMEIQAEK